MNDARYNLLMESDTEPLTPEEIAQGWHFCYEFDGLLRNNAEEKAEDAGAFQCDCLAPPALVSASATRCHLRLAYSDGSSKRFVIPELPLK